METKHLQDFCNALVVSRNLFEQSVLEIDAEIKRLQEQRKLVEQDYNKRNECIYEMFKIAPKEPIVLGKKPEFNIKEFIGEKLSQWKSPVIDAMNARVRYEMKKDHIEMSIFIPFKPKDED